jgi:hypothetical protein
VRPEFVNYAKRAKRVDVRKLKENIWKGLDIVVPEPVDGDEMASSHPCVAGTLLIITRTQDQDQDEKDVTDPTEARQFSSVVDGLKSAYPVDKMSEISTSFCFICLLHLANERGLRLEVKADGMRGEPPNAEVEDDKANMGGKVGDIWGLKVRGVLRLSYLFFRLTQLITGVSRSGSDACCIVWREPSVSMYFGICVQHLVSVSRLVHIPLDRVVLYHSLTVVRDITSLNFGS